MAAKTKDQAETPRKPRSDSSMKFLRFIPYKEATKAPEPMPRVPMENFRSSSIRELRLASSMAFTLYNRLVSEEPRTPGHGTPKSDSKVSV